MTLTLNQMLLIILTVAAVVAVTFIVLFLAQLRKTAQEAQRTLIKAQEMMEDFKEIEAKLNANLEAVGEVVNQSKKALSGLSQMSSLVPPNALRSSAKYLPIIIPLLRFGWQLIKNRKEKHNGK